MSTAPPTVDRSRAALILVAICAAVLVLPASLTGTSVALPRISTDLDAALAPLQWVINAYNLAFACFMLACGSLADILGRRRVFTVGVLVFGLSGLISALTSNIYVLDAARGFAGLGAAAVMTAGSAILVDTFDGAALGQAFAALGASAGGGLALGPSTAGFLVGAFGWRAVFVSHAVVAALVLLAVPVMRESRNPEATRVDWVGTLTFTLSLFLLVLAVVMGPQSGWADPGVLTCLVAALALMVAFVVAELRQTQPMLDLGLFRQARFMSVSLIPVAMSFAFVCLLVLLPAYYTGVGGMSVDASGATMLLLTLPVLVVPLALGRLTAAGVSTRALLTVSLLLAAMGAGLLTLTGSDFTVVAIAGPLLLIGIGMGLTAGLVDAVAITSVEPGRAGSAAGVFNTIRLASEALAIALVSALLLNSVSGRIGDGLAATPAGTGADAGKIANQVVSGDLHSSAAGLDGAARTGFLDLLTNSYTGALHVILWVVVLISLLTAVVVFWMLRERPRTAADPADGGTADGGTADSDTTDMTDATGSTDAVGSGAVNS